LEFEYQIKYDPAVIEKIEDIRNYIEKVLLAPSAAKKRVASIFDDVAKIKPMPESYPSVDQKIGIQISKKFETIFTLIAGGKYLVFFFIDGRTIYITHLLPTETDYLSLFQ
jgi:plasmid stabilization system protein ParE